MNQIQSTCGKRRILIAELSYVIGSGDSANVFIEYASVRAANKDAAGVWKTPICESVICGGYVIVSEPCRISGTIKRHISPMWFIDGYWAWSEQYAARRQNRCKERAPKLSFRSLHDRWRSSPPSGNFKLLEAITAYSQILPRKRTFRGEATSKFYAAFLRGKAIVVPSLIYANYVTTAGSKLIFYLHVWSNIDDVFKAYYMYWQTNGPLLAWNGTLS